MGGEEKAPGRLSSGPRELGQLIPRLTRPAFRKISPAAAQIMADWAEIIGPGPLAAAQPLRLSAGTLTLACSGALALELSMLAPQLIARINAHLGRAAVQQLRFVQGSLTAPPTASRRAKRAEVPLPDHAEAALQTVPEGPLRDALERLGREVFRPEAKPVDLGPVGAVKLVGKIG
jgi:hypothetical protein